MTNTIVQYILLRNDLLKDLGWSIGAVVAQACHASTAVLHLYKDDEITQQYLNNMDNMHKVILEIHLERSKLSKASNLQPAGMYLTYVPDEEALKKIAEKLKENSIDHKLWIEQPENIPTCLALKPYPKDHVKKYVGKFKLYKETLSSSK